MIKPIKSKIEAPDNDESFILNVMKQNMVQIMHRIEPVP